MLRVNKEQQGSQCDWSRVKRRRQWGRGEGAVGCVGIWGLWLVLWEIWVTTKGFLTWELQCSDLHWNGIDLPLRTENTSTPRSVYCVLSVGKDGGMYLCSSFPLIQRIVNNGFSGNECWLREFLKAQMNRQVYAIIVLVCNTFSLALSKLNKGWSCFLAPTPLPQGFPIPWD